MEIVYLGHSAFRLKGKQSVVVVDPYSEKVGKLPRDLEADIVAISHGHEDHNNVAAVGGKPLVIDGPGEYEAKGLSVIGIHSWHDDAQGAKRGGNTIYVFEVDGVRVAHLGDLGHKLTQEQLEEMGAIDVLLLPVGGVYTLDAKLAVEVLRQVDPEIVIPMHYYLPGIEVGERLAEVDQFFKELGKETPPAVPKLVVTADKLPGELQAVLLERK